MLYSKPEIRVWRFSPRLMQGSEEEEEEDTVPVHFGTTIGEAWDRQEEIEL